MGGDMWVETEESKGSTFFLSVNIEKTSEGEEASNLSRSERKLREFNAKGKKKVLVVDSNPSQLQSLGKWKDSFVRNFPGKFFHGWIM